MSESDIFAILGLQSDTIVEDCLLQISDGSNKVFNDIQEYQKTGNASVAEIESSSYLKQELDLPKPYFEVLESKKEKAPPYLICDDTILCKKNERVNIVLKNGKLGQSVLVLMQYTDTNYGKKPVHPCGDCEKKHQETFLCTDHSGSNVCMKVEGNYQVFYQYCGDHLCARVSIPGNVDVLLQPAFVCLNSCQRHKDCGKKMTLVCLLMNDRTKDLIHEQQFQIRCCAAPKRDIDNIKRLKTGNIKRLKTTSEGELPEPPMKLEKMDDTEGCSQLEEMPIDSITAVPVKPQWIAFQMADIKKQMTICNLIEQLGGTFVPVEFQVKHKEQE